jgi:hypothetical protein
MSAITKPVQIRIRISPADETTLKTLAGSVLSVTDMASYLLHAAVACVRENPGKIPFPPRFLPSGVIDE